MSDTNVVHDAHYHSGTDTKTSCEWLPHIPSGKGSLPRTPRCREECAALGRLAPLGVLHNVGSQKRPALGDGQRATLRVSKCTGLVHDAHSFIWFILAH